MLRIRPTGSRLTVLVLTAWVATFARSAQSVGPAFPPPGTAPTFSRDIAPIVFANCSPCHRPGESGPFDLLTYRDVRARGRLIVEAIRRRYMPPWKPAPDGGGPFAGQ